MNGQWKIPAEYSALTRVVHVHQVWVCAWVLRKDKDVIARLAPIRTTVDVHQLPIM
jgi:hypothetical protein